MTTPFVSKSLADTRSFAEVFLKSLKSGDGATVVTLSGDLGAGKTAFTKELGSLLGIPAEQITSPTFVIMKIFDLPTSYLPRDKVDKLPASRQGGQATSFEHLIHIDAYRLEKEDELIKLGWDDIVSNPKNLIIIEWPELVPGLIPSNARMIKFTFIDEDTREISIT